MTPSDASSVAHAALGRTFNIRLSADSAAHATILLAAFALTIIILLIGADDIRRDEMSSFIVRPFLLAFVGNLIASFQFMVVQAATDQLPQSQIYVIAIAPELMIVASTSMMLLGISLAVMRYIRGPKVVRLVLWMFVIAAIYTLGVIQHSIADLYEIHGIKRGGTGEISEVTKWVFGVGLVVCTVEYALSRLQKEMDRLLDWNLRLCVGAFIISMVGFGYFVSLDGNWAPSRAWLRLLAFLITTIQWVVLGSSFIILNRFPKYSEEMPYPEPSYKSTEPPHLM